MNAAVKARQKWLARAETKFTKPEDHHEAKPCIDFYLSVSGEDRGVSGRRQEIDQGPLADGQALEGGLRRRQQKVEQKRGYKLGCVVDI